MEHKIREIILGNFNESIEAKQKVCKLLEEPVYMAANLIAKSFTAGGKMLICGNGGSASDSQHFAAEFTGRYEMERKPLPAIALSTDTSALTAIANDYSFDVIFSKQVEALGFTRDILFGISTSGNSANVIKAIEAAHNKGMHVIALTGRDGGKIAQLIQDGDVHINVPLNRTARVQETHILILHTLCDAIDNMLFKLVEA
ncbi:MAG: phosphoheptose isomerase [Proteobacteria bacterium]|jgi:D-sedoheptulose 7-phosphate isomerase|nr:phosphoheptose isomerase [Pseudomonadota bacterium]